MRGELVRWLVTQPLDVFATVTFKQALPNDGGTLTRLTPDIRNRTAWVLRDRVAKASRRKLPFIVFGEGDGEIKRYHAHILIQKPENLDFLAFSDLFRQKALRLNWIHKEIKIEPIEEGTHERIISYSLKEGCDAFIPEASHIP